MYSPGPERTRRVLVVEDSPVMRELFRITMAGMPVTLEQVGDGMAALKAVRAAEVPYDLILLDLNMPIMDGMKFLEQLSDEPAGTASVVAVVTTESSPDTEAEARALGARYFLRKPVTRKQVTAVLDDVLG